MAQHQPSHEPLPTIWRVPDDLWARIEPILATADPPARTGRPHSDHRAALDARICRPRTGCQWNQLPHDFPDDSSVHRTFQRGVARGICDPIWATLVAACPAVGGVEWDWQAADAALGKARVGGPRRPEPDGPRQAGGEEKRAGGGRRGTVGGRHRWRQRA